jgi:hypothetical protein
MSTSRWLTWTPPNGIIGKSAKRGPSKPTKAGFEGFAGTTPGSFQNNGAEPATKEDVLRRRVFPHCPRCASYALYRRNNVGKYECLTCELRDIDETAARRLQ